MIRRSAGLALACLFGLAADAFAQADYPSRPVKFIVNSAPGGGTDILARVLAQKLSKDGQNFFVENRGGGGGIVGIEAVRNSPADGYTLLMSPSTIAVLPAVTREARYDPTKDFAAITQVAGISNVLVVHPDVPAKNLQELIALARAKPGSLNYASAGAGSSPHMSMELLKHMTGIDLQHVPFRGTGPAMTEVLAGRIAALFSNMLTAKPLIEAGSCAPSRSPGRSASRRCPTCRPSPSPACRAIRRCNGTACSRRRARRSRPSSSFRLRSRKRCACRMCASGWPRTAPSRSAAHRRISPR